MENLSPETKIMTDIIRDTKHYYSIMHTISKKIIKDFPSLSANLKAIIEDIEIKGLIKNIEKIDDPFLNSNDYYELASYVQNIGEQSVVKLKENSDKLGEVINNSPENERSTLYAIRSDIYSHHQFTVGLILKEINKMLSINSTLPIQ